MGPFSDEQLANLNWDNTEILVNELVEKENFPKTEPLNQAMKDHPNQPHIFFNTSEG